MYKQILSSARLPGKIQSFLEKKKKVVSVTWFQFLGIMAEEKTAFVGFGTEVAGLLRKP